MERYEAKCGDLEHALRVSADAQGKSEGALKAKMQSTLSELEIATSERNMLREELKQVLHSAELLRHGEA